MVKIMRYETEEDLENDCLTLMDNEGELKTSFDSEIILFPLEDAQTVVDKLNWYERYYGLLVGMLKEHLEYHGWSEDDFKGVIEDVEANLE